MKSLGASRSGGNFVGGGLARGRDGHIPLSAHNDRLIIEVGFNLVPELASLTFSKLCSLLPYERMLDLLMMLMLSKEVEGCIFCIIATPKLLQRCSQSPNFH